jgi:hypothetical protein
MGAVRQAATVLVYAFVPVLLVVGSLALAMTEVQPAQVATPSPSGQVSRPTSRPAASQTRAGAAPTSSGSGTATATVRFPTAPPTSAPSTATLILHPETPAPASPFPTASAQVQMLFAPTMGCGPFQGWIMGYVVRPGDTLYRIALRYRTSVSDLKQGNCRTSSLIYVGERLWVPYVPAYGWRWPAKPTRMAPWEYQSQQVLPPETATPYP